MCINKIFFYILQHPLRQMPAKEKAGKVVKAGKVTN